MSDFSDRATEDEWLSVSDCARRLGVSERTIQRRVKHLPPSDIWRRPGQPQRVRFLALSESVPAVAAPESEEPTLPDATPTPAVSVEHLLQEIDFLRRQNETLTAILGRLAIEKPAEVKETAQEQKTPEKRSWWQFWAFWKGRE